MGTFDSDAFAGPLFLKGGEALPLADADDVLFEIKLLGVKAQQSQPQLAHRLGVLRLLGEPPPLGGAKPTPDCKLNMASV